MKLTQTFLRPIIGPFKYKIRELAKAGVIIVPSANMDDLVSSDSKAPQGVELRVSSEKGSKEGRSWMDGVVKMSCTSPGNFAAT